MNTRDEIMQALEDFEAGRLGTIPPNALMPHVPDPDPVRAEHTGYLRGRPALRHVRGRIAAPRSPRLRPEAVDDRDEQPQPL